MTKGEPIMQTIISCLGRTGFMALVVMAATALSMGTVRSEAVTIKLETYAGPKHLMNSEVWPTWAKQVEEASGGSIKVRVTHPPINPRGLYDRVRDGISDMAWFSPAYTTGRFVLTTIVEVPGMKGTAEQMSRAYWRIHKKHLERFGEHKGVALLSVFTHGPGMIHTRKPVTAVTGIKGLKIRTGGGVQSQLGKRLGVVTVAAPVTKAQELLSRGVADGVFFSMETICSFKLGGAVKYHYSVPGGFYSNSFGVIMNKKKYDSLTAAQRKAIQSVAGEGMAGMIGAAWDRNDKSCAQNLTKVGNTVITDGPLASGVKPKIADMDAWWIQRAKKEGLTNAADVLKELRAEIKKLK